MKRYSMEQYKQMTNEERKEILNKKLANCKATVLDMEFNSVDGNKIIEYERIAREISSFISLLDNNNKLSKEDELRIMEIMNATIPLIEPVVIKKWFQNFIIPLFVSLLLLYLLAKSITIIY